MTDNTQPDAVNLGRSGRVRKSLSRADALVVLLTCHDMVIDGVCRGWQ